MQILLSNSQAGPGRTANQEQEEISRNHVQAFFRTLYVTFFLPCAQQQNNKMAKAAVVRRQAI